MQVAEWLSYRNAFDYTGEGQLDKASVLGWARLRVHWLLCQWLCC